MKCPKCAGLMVEQRYVDAHVSLYEWKCINCGLRRNVDGSPVHKGQPFAHDVHPWSKGGKCAPMHPPDAAGLLYRVQPGARGSRKPEPVPAAPLAA